MLCRAVAISTCEAAYPERWHVTGHKHIWVNHHVTTLVEKS